MAERRHGAPAPPTDSTVTGADWDGRDISGEQHNRVLFVDLDFTEGVNHGAAFTDCTFKRAKFNSSSHTDAAFVNCTFLNCTFFETRFTECKFVGSMFDRCTFDIMTVHGGNWSFVGLPGADLRKATFDGVRLREADLTGANCDGGKIRGSDMSGASLHAAKLTDCDLRGSDVSSIEPAHTDLRGAIVTYNQALAIANSLGLDMRDE